MFGHGPKATGYRRFLKRIGTNGGGGYLAAKHHDRGRICQGVTHRRDHIGGTGPRGHHHYTHLAACACIARCHETGTLLVRGYDQRYRVKSVTAPMLVVVTENRIIGGQDRATTVAKDGVYTLIGQHLHNDIGTGHFFAGKRMWSWNCCFCWLIHKDMLIMCNMRPSTALNSGFPKCRVIIHALQ